MVWFEGNPQKRKQEAKRLGRLGPAHNGNKNVIESKVSMKELFGTFKPKSDGTNGKMRIMPEIHELHRREIAKYSWIKYSALDAKVWFLEGKRRIAGFWF